MRRPRGIGRGGEVFVIVKRIVEVMLFQRLNHRPQIARKPAGDTVGYTAGRHFYNLPNVLDMGELCTGSGNSLICNNI